MSNELSKPVDETALAIPDWMREDGKLGTEELSRYIVPPRLIIVQKSAKAPLDRHDAGTALLMPNERIIAEFDKSERISKEPFFFVPIFYFVEYTLDNPVEVHATHGKVRERSLDHDSEIAQRANNWKLRTIPCPEKPDKLCSYTVRLNYLLWVMREDISEPCMITFKRAEMRTGMDFNSLIKARQAPMFGCQFQAEVGYRENDKGAWYGLNITNPNKEVGGWVKDKELYELFKAENARFTEAHKARLITPSDDDEHVDFQASNEASEF